MCLCVLVHLYVHVCVLEVGCYIRFEGQKQAAQVVILKAEEMYFLSAAASTAGTDLKDVKILSSLSI